MNEMEDTYILPDLIDESITYSITVSDLLRAPFNTRADADKLQIVLGEKPRPVLKLTGITLTENNDKICLDFKTSIYDEISWITGCERKNSIFCWPCLLFGSPSVWNSTGFSDIMLLKSEALKHEKSSSHVTAVEQMYKFVEKEQKLKNERVTNKPGDWTPKDQQLKDVQFNLPEKSSHQNKNHKISNVSKNIELVQSSHIFVPSAVLIKHDNTKDTEIIKKLIDACCLAFQRSFFNETFVKNFFESEKYIEILQFLSTCDNCNTGVYNDAIHLINKSPAVIGSIFKAIVKFVELSIKQEVQTSKYVALVINQHGDIESEQKLSIILRYMKNGALLERFVGFTRVSHSLSVNVLYNIFEATLQKYEIGNKICALSLDGSILQMKDLSDFVDKVGKCHPYCLFLPWHGHDTNYILQQSLSSLPACKQFFKMMGALQIFFQENSEQLRKIINENFPSLVCIYSNADIISDYSVINRFASSQFIVTVKNFREDFINLFDFVIKSCSKTMGDSSIRVLGFRKYLKELQTMFLFEILTRLFNCTNSLDTALKNNDYEFCNGRQTNAVTDILIKINKLHFGKYNEIWSCLKSASQELSDTSEYEKNKQLHYPLFNVIIYHTKQEIYIRYQQIVKLTFLNMFNLKTNGGLGQIQFWAQGFKETKRQLNGEQMYNELVVLLDHSEFSKKSVTDFNDFITEANLHHIFKSLSDVSELILVMLFKPTSRINNTSILQVIEKWCVNYASVSNDPLSILYIEDDIYQTLKQLPSFHEDVISIDLSFFLTKSNR